jgi:UDP-GlcNAc:undecaprenyl-phosphate/decaprenyl-phosphate GlcNAc-1-phosphate transferase
MSFWIFVSAAFMLTAVFAVLLRPVAFALGLVDRPDARKVHEGNIPLIGGIAIFLGTGIALLAYVFLTEEGKLLLLPISIFLVSGFILLAVGIWDDLRNFRPLCVLLPRSSRHW